MNQMTFRSSRMKAAYRHTPGLPIALQVWGPSGGCELVERLLPFGVHGRVDGEVDHQQLIALDGRAHTAVELVEGRRSGRTDAETLRRACRCPGSSSASRCWDARHSRCVPRSNPTCCHDRPESRQTRRGRAAVSSSCTFIRNPPSPQSATFGPSGSSRDAATRPGRAIPIAARALLTIRAFGRATGRSRPAHILCAPTSEITRPLERTSSPSHGRIEGTVKAAPSDGRCSRQYPLSARMRWR